MRILVDIGHPAHVHLFKNAVWEWQGRGYNVAIAARDKDVTIELLKAYGFKYEISSVRRKGIANLGLELCIRVYNLLKLARRFRPDLFLSRGSPSAALASTILRKPHVTFEDMEHSVEQYYLYAPFTDIICTSSCFKRDLGKKQIRYEGYDVLAYLHPHWFTPNPNVLQEIGLSENERFFIVRFVSWEATHDIRQRGFTEESKERLITTLEKYGRVIITSEAPLPLQFERYRMPIAPTKIHDLLYYATMYVGEGATMACEAALLGTPSIFVNTLPRGYLEELEHRYGLVYSFADQDTALKRAIVLLGDKDLREKWRLRRQKMLSEKIDVTKFMVDFVEKYRSKQKDG